MKINFKRHAINLAYTVIIIFAAIGFILTAGFFAVKFGWTNTGGVIDDRFITPAASGTKTKSPTSLASSFTPNSPVVIVGDGGWQASPEWQTLRIATAGDAATINKIAQVTGVPARLIVAPLIVEQLRLFTSDREVFKRFFGPLKILGNQTQFSWGVTGLKEDTAKQIENNLKNTQSPFYLGPAYVHALDFPSTGSGQVATTTSIDAQRYNRITAKDHAYAYLYTALYLKQIMKQWDAAGFPINDRPEVLATLYNIGFNHSIPKATPAVGGAQIEVNGKKYSFGGLAYDFYYSNELLSEFPR